MANFKNLQAAGHLLRESEPSVYIYQQQMGDHLQQGLVALSHVEDYLQEKIRKHEKTRVDKENDRTRLTSEMSANAGPVFLTYREKPELTAFMKKASSGEPLYDLIADDGIRHTAWRVPGGQAAVEAFASVPFTYVADGHHRAASAARVAHERRQANPAHTGNEDYNWFLTVLFPANQLNILPYNRIVHDLNGMDPGECLARIDDVSRIDESDSDTPAGPGDIRFFLGNKWYRIQLRPAESTDPVRRLDVSLLQERIPGPVLGIDDPRTSERIDFVGGIRGTAYLEIQVARGAGAIAFSMHSVSVDQLMDIADAGQIMPPKSTWFEPKLRSGFFIHTF